MCRSSASKPSKSCAAPARPALHWTRGSACCWMEMEFEMPLTKHTSASSSTDGRIESRRLAEQLRNAFAGEAWHGPALLELLAEVDSATAAAHPFPGVHSI